MHKKAKATHSWKNTLIDGILELCMAEEYVRGKLRIRKKAQVKSRQPVKIMAAIFYYIIPQWLSM